MAKRRKKNYKSLHGTAATTRANKKTVMETLKEGGLMLVSAVAAGGAGAVIGKHSLLVGIPVTLFGVHKGNKYITSAGLGLCLSNGFQKQQSSSMTTNGIDDEMDGFSMEEVKERVGNYFKNFSEKLYLPKAQATQPTSGLGANDQPTYFINPYQTTQLQGNDLDLSQLDRVQEQIAQMSGFGEVHREF